MSEYLQNEITGTETKNAASADSETNNHLHRHSEVIGRFHKQLDIFNELGLSR